MRRATVSALLVCALASPNIAETIHVPGDYETIQAAVDAAYDGDVVLVGPGTYTGDGNRNIEISFPIELRSVAGPEQTVIDVEGGPNDLARGFWLVGDEPGQPGPVISGFTIRGGYQVGVTGDPDPERLTGGGGGIYLRNINAVISNCRLEDNVSAEDYNPWTADGRGAGIYVDDGTDIVVDGCLIRYCEADRRGGAIYLGFDEENITDARTVIVSNTVMHDNLAMLGSGLYSAFVPETVVSGCTIAHNESWLDFAGGVTVEEGTLRVRNSIIWWNGPSAAMVHGGALFLNHSNFEGGKGSIFVSAGLAWWFSSVDEDPELVKPSKRDYRLTASSPMFDAGSNKLMLGSLDAGQNPRLQGPSVDIGAFERLLIRSEGFPDRQIRDRRRLRSP